MEKFYLLTFKGLPILEQLRLEEALLRLDQRNWLICNEGSPLSIVMGISGKPEELLNEEKVWPRDIPVIKRYSGGGTVVVDSETLFVSVIANRSILPFPCFPEKLMGWNAGLYESVLNKDFSLRENDYTFGQKKFGGNAQSITKDRWVHHSTLLWDFDPQNMELLKLPKKRPDYRGDRSHSDFLCTLKDSLPHKQALFDGVMGQLSKSFELCEGCVEEVRELALQKHRQSTERLKAKLSV